MTQQEKLTQVFNEFGIPFTIKPVVIGYERPEPGKWPGKPVLDPERQVNVIIPEGNGYDRFRASFTFDKEGKFLSHAIYE